MRLPHLPGDDPPGATMAHEPPMQIRISRDRDMLTLGWKDGNTTRLSARILRANCQSAGAKSLRILDLEAPPRNDIAIDEVRTVGVYAINIVFSDGHARGIYPWAYLKSLTEFDSDPAADAVPNSAMQ